MDQSLSIKSVKNSSGGEQEEEAKESVIADLQETVEEQKSPRGKVHLKSILG